MADWLLSPNGGENIFLGSNINIALNTTLYDPGVLSVELYKGTTRVYGPSTGGVSDRFIPTGGLTAGSGYRVRIYNPSSPSYEDWSNSSFSIESTLGSWLLSPNGGESISLGANINVTINTIMYSPGTLSIELYRNGSKVYGPSTGGVSNRFIPTSGLATGYGYSIHIYDAANPGYEDWSDASFAIVNPFDSWLLLPNGAEVYAIGQNINISVDNGLASPTSMMVELYKGSTLVFGPEAGSATNRVIPTNNLSKGSDYKIKVYDQGDPNAYDWSDGYFSIGINPALSNWLQAPNGSEFILWGQEIEISVNNGLLEPPLLNVELYRQDQLIFGPEAGGVYNRTIPTSQLIPGSDYKIRIFDPSNSLNEDWSNNSFSIGSDPTLENWLTVPNGGNTISLGANINLEINGQVYSPSTVAIELYKGNLRVYGPGYAGITNRSIPTAGLSAGDDYSVRIFDASDPLKDDWSNSVFTVGTYPELNPWLVYPNGGEVFIKNGTINVSANPNLLNPSTIGVEVYSGITRVLGPIYSDNTELSVTLAGLNKGNYYKVKVFDVSDPQKQDWSDAVFSIIDPLEQWLVFPNKDEIFSLEEDIAVSINSQLYGPSDVTIELYRGGQLVFGPVSGGLVNRVIPTASLEKGTGYKLKIHDTNDPSKEDWSEGTFSVGMNPILTNWLETPNGLEYIVLGGDINIGLNEELLSPSALSVELYKGETKVFGPESGDVSNRKITTIGLQEGDDYRVRIFDSSNDVDEDWSNSYFTIGTEPVANEWLAYPNGGEKILVGTTIDVTVDPTKFFTNVVSVEIYEGSVKVAGPSTSSYTNLSISTQGLPSGDNYRVRVFDSNNPFIEDFSNSYFSIIHGGNFVREKIVLKPGVVDNTGLSDLVIGEKFESIKHFDGLGRITQTISIHITPGNKDLIHSVVYDELGREHKLYLPYTTQTNRGEYQTDFKSVQQQFYNTENDLVAINSKPYSVTVFEPSPLNRVLKQGAPGTAWQPDEANPTALNDHSVKMRYETNGVDDVLLLEYDETAEVLDLDNGLMYYSPNQLYANKTFDEHNNEVIEYVDKEGRTVLKRVQYDEQGGTKLYAETYYIYDDFGNLVMVLPPEGVKALRAAVE